MKLPPLALYVHIPWCVKKCPYCDFNSHKAGTELPEQAYVDALLEDLRASLALVQARRLTSIFFGGGTPSLLSAGASWLKLLDGAEQMIGFARRILKSPSKPIPALSNSPASTWFSPGWR